MECLSNPGIFGPSLDLDLFPGTSSATPNFPFQPVHISEVDKSILADSAANALEEFLRLIQSNEPLWIKSSTDGRDFLNLESYESVFPRANSSLKNPNIRTEASRASGVVFMNSLALVELLMDPVSSFFSCC